MMKKSKDYLACALILSLCLGLVACSGKITAVSASTELIQPTHSSLQGQTTEAPINESDASNPFASAGVGDLISFGSYEQDNDSANGAEPIDWIVLDKDGDTLTLLSRYALDARQFNLTQTDAPWESCTLRQWLNHEFLNSAFSASEQALILDTIVTGDANPSWGTDGGPDTVDKVYLLSMVEAQQCLSFLDIGKCEATAYADAREVFKMSGHCWWWLRTPGSSLPRPTYVDQDGDVSSSGRDCNFDNGAVRPVIRLSADSAQSGADLTPGSAQDPGHADPYKVGDILFFGHYEQDNNLSNGQEPIEWIVLARDGGMALLTSLNGLDQQTYNETYTDVTWESCTLRRWLNDAFLYTAFSDDERKAIQDSTVTAEDNPRFGTEAGNDTVDKVFLLSLTEAEAYLDTKSAKQIVPTAYAEARGVSSYNGYCTWWLRSPGENNRTAAYVYNDGSVLYQGFSVLRSNGNVFKDDFAIRPALWVNLSAISD